MSFIHLAGVLEEPATFGSSLEGELGTVTGNVHGRFKLTLAWDLRISRLLPVG